MKDEEKILKMLQEELGRNLEQLNTAPNPAIDDLSPTDMQSILYSTFDKESPIQFKEQVGKEVLDQIPFLNLMIDYLTIIQETKELKLTTKGNLPRKLCFELYGKGYIKEDPIESGITKLSKEADSIVLQNLKFIGELGGLTKKKNNKLSLTKKGAKLLLPENNYELLKVIFKSNYQKLNFGYHDLYPDEVDFNIAFGYTLYLLLKYGAEERKVLFYSDKKILAFPMFLEYFDSKWRNKGDQFFSCYTVRVFERFLDYYGFITYEKEDRLEYSKNKVQTTAVFREIFELNKANLKFKFRRKKRRR